MEEKDLYKIIGTSRQAVAITIEDKARSEKEQNLFIKEKAEHTIKLLEIKKNSPMRSEEERRRIERQIEEVEHAYNKLRTIDLRNTYNAILDSQVAELKPKLPLQRDAYQILLTSRTVQGYERTFNDEEQISAVMKVYGESDVKHKKVDQELGG